MSFMGEVSFKVANGFEMVQTMEEQSSTKSGELSGSGGHLVCFGRSKLLHEI